MIRCLDIHTHHSAPQPEGVVSSTMESFAPMEGQLYSIGIHPWDTDINPGSIDWDKFTFMASQPCVMAIGECGIDKLKGGPLFKQMLIFKQQIDLSEKLGKPLIIHDVKAHDVIVGLKKDLNPSQNWMVHGFRGKPSVAKMLTDAGIFLSFGEKFNPDTPKEVPSNMLLAETDDSPLYISEIIQKLSANLGHDVTNLIASNTFEFLFGNSNHKNEISN